MIIRILQEYKEYYRNNTNIQQYYKTILQEYTENTATIPQNYCQKI